jgi:hypothetical protein
MLARLLSLLCLGLILATPAAAAPIRSAFRSSLDSSIHGSWMSPSRSWSSRSWTSRAPKVRPARPSAVKRHR